MISRLEKKSSTLSESYSLIANISAENNLAFECLIIFDTIFQQLTVY